MNIRFLDIKYVLTIAEEKSITKAANKLYIAQPSLSQTLRKIEDELGAKLFVREHNQNRLTPAGEVFLQYGNEILRLYGEMNGKIGDINSERNETANLGMPFFLGTFLAPKIISIHKQFYPQARINLIEETSSVLEEQLISGKIDFAILPTPILSHELQYQPLIHSRMVLLAAANDPLNRMAYRKESDPDRPYIDIRLVDKCNFLLGSPGQRIREINELIFQKAGISPSIVFSSKSIDTIQRISATGMGYAIVPLYYMEQFGTTNMVNYFYIESEYDYLWTLALVYQKEEKLSPAARKLMKTVTNIYRTTA